MTYLQAQSELAAAGLDEGRIPGNPADMEA